MAHVQKISYTSRRMGKKTTAWQGRYTAPDGRERTKRFKRKVDAENWGKANEGDLVRGAWVDPKAGQVTLRAFADSWLEQRPDLRPTTRSKYRHLLDRHILPSLGDTPLNRLAPNRVRIWHADISRQHRATAAGAYRLLATVCNTAVTDEVIVRSPCRVQGAADERAAERPVASVAEVNAATEACPEQYRLAILLAAWCQLRRGEILGLQRQDIDALRAKIEVVRAWLQVQSGPAEEGPPKTKAGRRTINIPPNVMVVLRDHLERFTGPSRDAWLFPGEKGRPVSPRTLDRAWDTARRAVGRGDLRLHDLRHTGLTWSAGLGATTAELMYRAGHKSPTAALRYQHAAQERDEVLADALGALATGDIVHLRRTKDGRSSPGGTANAAKGSADQERDEQPQRDSNPCRHLERVVS